MSKAILNDNASAIQKAHEDLSRKTAEAQEAAKRKEAVNTEGRRRTRKNK